MRALILAILLLLATDQLRAQNARLHLDSSISVNQAGFVYGINIAHSAPLQAAHGAHLLFQKNNDMIAAGTSIGFSTRSGIGLRLGVSAWSNVSYQVFDALAVYVNQENAAGYYPGDIDYLHYTNGIQNYYNFSLGASYRYRLRRWRLDPYLGLSRGYITYNDFRTQLKAIGSNYFKTVRYETDRTGVWSLQTSVDISLVVYARKRHALRPGISLGYAIAAPEYKIRYTEQVYGQPEQRETISIRDPMQLLCIGTFLNVEIW